MCSLLELAAESPTIILCYFPERQNELRRLLLDPCKSLMSNNESPCSIVLLSSVGQPFAERLQQVRSMTFIPASLICICSRPLASKQTLNFHNRFSFFYTLEFYSHATPISKVKHLEDISENHKFSNTCHRVKKVLISSIGKAALKASVAGTFEKKI